MVALVWLFVFQLRSSTGAASASARKSSIFPLNLESKYTINGTCARLDPCPLKRARNRDTYVFDNSKSRLPVPVRSTPPEPGRFQGSGKYSVFQRFPIFRICYFKKLEFPSFERDPTSVLDCSATLPSVRQNRALPLSFSVV